MSYEIHIWPKGTKNKTMHSKGFKWDIYRGLLDL